MRPHVIQCLKRIKEELNYDIIAFTASLACYSNEVLNIIDKNYEIFSLRLFREHCLKIELNNTTNYIKDLSIFHNVSLKDMLIVDNSIISFVFHITNGIAILPYYDNKSDRELVYLCKYLESIVDSSDLRVPNRKHIKYIIEEIKDDYYNQKQSKSLYNRFHALEFYDSLNT